MIVDCICKWQRAYDDKDGTFVVERIEKWDPMCPAHQTAKVIIFKGRGKYYTEDVWRIPRSAIGPYDMINSPDATKWVGPDQTWIVLVETQEPWGHPFLIVPEDQRGGA